MNDGLLEVQDLHVQLPRAGKLTTVIDGVDLSVRQGEILGIAGESGSGKTLTMLSLLGLAPANARITGKALFDGRDLLQLRREELRRVTGPEIGIIFQDPMSTLHPMLSVGTQMTDHLRRHLKMSRRAARTRAEGLLEELRIPDPASALRSYPHQFSGGMRQRIALAIALACRPRLLIADEPTTALDVTVQASILHSLASLQQQFQLTVILITHDLGVSSAIANRLAVFYAGSIVELGSTEDVLRRPRHPYTAALLDALPHAGADGHEPVRMMEPIPGSLPTPEHRPRGCLFHPRCDYAIDACVEHRPPLEPAGAGRAFACPVDPFRE